MPVEIDDVTNDVRRTPEGARLYRCDCCGAVSPWNDNWAWFGSYRQAEDFGLKDTSPVMTICSADCRVSLVASGKLPREGLDDGGNIVEAPVPPTRKWGQRRNANQQTPGGVT